MKRCILLFACVAALAAQEAKAPPKVSDAQRAAYWRAVAEFNLWQAKFLEAQQQLNAADAKLKGIQRTLCPDAKLTVGGDGEPSCEVTAK